MINNKNNSGLIKLIAIIIIAVLVLSYFGINIQKIAESQVSRDNFGYIWQVIQQTIIQIGDWLTNLTGLTF